MCPVSDDEVGIVSVIQVADTPVHTSVNLDVVPGGSTRYRRPLMFQDTNYSRTNCERNMSPKCCLASFPENC